MGIESNPYNQSLQPEYGFIPDLPPVIANTLKSWSRVIVGQHPETGFSYDERFLTAGLDALHAQVLVGNYGADEAYTMLLAASRAAALADALYRFPDRDIFIKRATGYAALTEVKLRSHPAHPQIREMYADYPDPKTIAKVHFISEGLSLDSGMDKNTALEFRLAIGLIQQINIYRGKPLDNQEIMRAGRTIHNLEIDDFSIRGEISEIFRLATKGKNVDAKEFWDMFIGGTSDFMIDSMRKKMHFFGFNFVGGRFYRQGIGAQNGQRWLDKVVNKAVRPITDFGRLTRIFLDPDKHRNHFNWGEMLYPVVMGLNAANFGYLTYKYGFMDFEMAMVLGITAKMASWGIGDFIDNNISLSPGEQMYLEARWVPLIPFKGQALQGLS